MADEEESGLLEDIEVVEAMIKSVASNLGMLIDREFTVGNLRVKRVHKRPAGLGAVHISFRMGFGTSEGMRQGSMIVPLPEALSLAAYMMCVPDAAVKTHRLSREPDASTKDALLEVGNMTGGALNDTVRGLCGGDGKVVFIGCQGVRAAVRPAFEYEEGDELVVGRATARIHEFPEFELIIMFPELPAMGASAGA